MKMHTNQWLSHLLSPTDIPCGATNQGTHPRAGAQAPPQGPERGRSPALSSCKHLKTKHFHVALAGNQHPHVLKSRYGKVRKKDTVVKPPGLSSPCTMKCGEGLLTAFGVGFTPHVQRQACANLPLRAYAIDIALHLAIAPVAAFHRIGRGG